MKKNIEDNKIYNWRIQSTSRLTYQITVESIFGSFATVEIDNTIEKLSINKQQKIVDKALKKALKQLRS